MENGWLAFGRDSHPPSSPVTLYVVELGYPYKATIYFVSLFMISVFWFSFGVIQLFSVNSGILVGPLARRSARLRWLYIYIYIYRLAGSWRTEK